MSQLPPSSYQSSPRPGPPNNGREPGIAVVALVLGIVAILLAPLLIFGVAALIVGIMAVNRTGGPDNIPGRGKAIAGLAMGGSSFAVAVVMVLLIGILLPALGAARRTARRMQNSTQLRGIHQGMVISGQRNKFYYPGLDSKGNIIANDPTLTGNSGDGNTVEARFWALLDGSYITPDYAISPSEIDAKYDWPGSGPVTSDHYSYAMSSIAGSPGQAPGAAGRAMEWKETANTQAIIMSDRDINPGGPPASIHTDQPGKWKGSMLWNDNHVAFEQSNVVTLGTRYGSGSMNMQDDLFVDETNGFDAWMIYEGD